MAGGFLLLGCLLRFALSYYCLFLHLCGSFAGCLQLASKVTCTCFLRLYPFVQLLPLAVQLSLQLLRVRGLLSCHGAQLDGPL